MHRCQKQLLFPFLIMGMFIACSLDETAHKTLLLSLSVNNDRHQVSGYQVVNQSFKKSHQQGNYQAHLFDRDGDKIHEITFQKIENPVTTGEKLTVSVPLYEKLHKVVIYRMDGRSGHYQLPDEPLLVWRLPRSVKEEIESVQN